MQSKPLSILGKVDQICRLYLQSVAFSKPLEILPSRGTRPNQKNKCRRILKKENFQIGCKTNLECRKVKCEANSNKNRQTRLILCSTAMDEVKREVRIISSVSYYFLFFSNIIKSHIIWQALVPFLLLTLSFLGYNQETM